MPTYGTWKDGTDEPWYWCRAAAAFTPALTFNSKHIVPNAVLCLVTQLCPTLSDPMDRSPSFSSLCGILQARILEWVAMPSSRGSSWPRDGTQVSRIAGGFFTVWATRETQYEIPLFNSSLSAWGKQEEGRQKSMNLSDQDHMTIRWLLLCSYLIFFF